MRPHRICLVFLSLGFAACATRQISDQITQCRFDKRLFSMGTVFEIQYLNACSDKDENLWLQVQDLLDKMESEMSLYQSRSDISKLNFSGELENPPQHLKNVVNISLKNAPLTDGYFDITVWPVLVEIQKSFKEHDGPPSDRVLEGLRSLVDYRLVTVNDKKIAFKKKGMMITLDGVAKGYAVDQIADFLLSQGMHDFLINFSGNMRASGHSLHGKPWSVAIWDPVEKKAHRIDIRENSIATSGVDYNYYSEDKRWHHLIDPKTLHPANVMVSATISGPSATMCDLLSKTFVMGPAEAQKVMSKNFSQYKYYLRTRDQLYTNMDILKDPADRR